MTQPEWLDDWSDEIGEHEYPDEPDHDESYDDEPEYVTCPHCGEEVYEEASQCPYCGDYIATDTSPWAGQAWWWVGLGVLGVIAVIWLLSGIARL